MLHPAAQNVDTLQRGELLKCCYETSRVVQLAQRPLVSKTCTDTKLQNYGDVPAATDSPRRPSDAVQDGSRHRQVTVFILVDTVTDDAPNIPGALITALTSQAALAIPRHG